VRRGATGVSAERAAVGAYRRVDSRDRESTSRVIPGELDDHVLHCVRRESVSFVDMGKKLFADTGRGILGRGP
jgi:hypothetical protein